MENFSIFILITFIRFPSFIASEQISYVPTDNITLNCGAFSDLDGPDGRFWTGEKNSKFGPIESSHNKSEAYVAAAQGDSVDDVPYMTARVSTSEFKYTFPVTPGQKFVRLYFYPASYNKLDTSKALFSVKAGSFTLLKNFSASLVAKSLGLSSFSREFCLNIEKNQVLDLVFTPSPSAANDSTYAFINGIEIVSMPPNLYYTPPESIEDVPFIGQTTGFTINNYTALEMVYRLNVGGKSISPMDDTGMYRLWVNDIDFLWSSSFSNVNITAPIKYTLIPRYTAPENVYRTARSMGPNLTYNERHNLTWRLPVDSGFRYLVRLHFWEPNSLINSAAERQFMIFINSQPAEAFADVMIWAADSHVPVYRDYVLLLLKKGSENKENITIDLHPRSARYYDALLNGIEVFKLNNSDGNLAGPNPELPVAATPSKSSNSTGGKSKMKRRLLIAGGGCAVGLLILLSLVTMVVWLHRKRQYYGSYSVKNWFCKWINHSKGKSRGSSSLPEELCCHFSLDEIKAATNNFHDDLIIGKGGFGKVYKGFLYEGEKTVAIKRLNPESKQGIREFLTEIEMLSQLRHVHLVSLIGYCYEKEKSEMILVYDFMSNGTLSDHLYGASYDPLTWKQRLEICRGAATGLNYLHTEVKHTVIHRDVKTSNILLDDQFVAKVSDFGLSKMDQKVDKINTAVKGTWGYLDPEYARGHPLTEKSDVYSFGVVLFEVLCARKALDKKLPEAQMNLANWARKCIADGTLYKVIDPYLIGKIAPECFKVLVEIAESCIAEVRVNRPSMNDVMEKLGFGIELQKDADIEKEKINLGSERSYPDTVFQVACGSDDKSGTGILDSSTTGMTYPTTSSGTLSDLLSSTSNTKSTGD